MGALMSNAIPPHPMNLCQSCKKNPIQVHVLGVEEFHGFQDSRNKVHFDHLCESCAAKQDVPFAMPTTKHLQNIWELLSQKAQGAAAAAKKPRGKSCNTCGMDLVGFQQHGRLGCEDCYETFAPELRNLFERIHGASTHSGRRPGEDPEIFERRVRIEGLERELEAAIEQEAYERAAGIRDELKNLERTGGGPSSAAEAT